MRKRRHTDYKRRQRLAEAIVAPDRKRCVLLLGKTRSVLTADTDADLLRLRKSVTHLYFDRRINRSETRDRYPDPRS
jgi:hypothetical protein